MNKTPDSRPVAVGYDARALTIDSRRTLLISGAIHYPRSTPAMWPELMRRSREAGLNAIETYAFWGLHERRRGVFDFSGRLDLLKFCRIAQENGLHVVARLGPYVCAEINYGGFPAWLRDVPGMRMRTDNEPFKAEMERWLRFLCEYLRPMLAKNGGPIIAAQIENEYSLVAENYGEEGQKYLAWVSELAASLDLGIPWVMCKGAAAGTIETLNGFTVHDEIDELRKTHPQQPAIWTELWPGWYGAWGRAEMTRSPGDLAYVLARFVAGGGTGVNYYMWHGGTNFGRDSMYLQTTKYFGFAPLDEYGLETTRSKHLARLHGILHDHSQSLLLENEPRIEKLGEMLTHFAWSGGGRTLSFYCNDSSEQEASVQIGGVAHRLLPRSILLAGDDRVLLNTTEVDAPCVIERSMRLLERSLSKIQTWPEPLPGDWPEGTTGAVEAAGPIEQLLLTSDQTDYCWYTTTLAIDATQARDGVLSIEGVADVVHLFLNGQYAASTPTPLNENRGAIDGPAFTQTFALKVRPLVNRIQLLCCSLGLIKGDWMIGDQNMALEKKGIWGRMLWNGQPIKPLPWSMRVGLLGEELKLFGTPGEIAPWKPATRAGVNKPLQWYRATFDRPAGVNTDAPLAVDLAGMGKGMAWLNGHCIGRYWLIRSSEVSPDAWQLKACVPGPAGELVQRFYHLPAQWLQKRNSLVLFEEMGGDPDQIRLCQWKRE